MRKWKGLDCVKLKRWHRFKRRKGFTLVEVIATAVLISLIVVIVVQATMSVNALRVKTSDSVRLSVHNLNTIERLRQMCQDETYGLLRFYGDEVLGSTEVETTATIDWTLWDRYYIYDVVLESKMRGTGNRLVSRCVITDIVSTELPVIVGG